jgi:hypothetical protein
MKIKMYFSLFFISIYKKKKSVYFGAGGHDLNYSSYNILRNTRSNFKYKALHHMYVTLLLYIITYYIFKFKLQTFFMVIDKEKKKVVLK